MKIGLKILLLAVVSNIILASGLYKVISYFAQKNNQTQIDQIGKLLIEEKKEYLKDIVGSAYAIAEKYSEIESEEIVKERVIKLLSSPRYDIDKSAYFFAYHINDDGTYSFAFHATKPNLNGKITNIETPDPKGFAFRKALIEGALSGGKFVEYHYQKGKEKDNIQPKLSYSKYFEKWKWVLVGGIYMDNIEAAKQANKVALDKNLEEILNTVMKFAFFLVLISLFLSVKIAKKISAPIKQTTENIEKLARGATSIEVKITTTDEIADMQAAMLNLLESFRTKIYIATKIAEGDLSVNAEVQSKDDELGIALQNMTHKLNDVLYKIQDAAGQVNSGAHQVSDASQSLSQGATEQAASLQEISSSIAHIGTQTNSNAENATQTSELAKKAESSAIQCSSDMSEMEHAMLEISESSSHIKKVIKVIDEIAFQTNLLALNASVEAARAGIHGKGFAVVADEVRALAGRSSNAAKETSELVEKAIGKISIGNQITGKTGKSLQSIVESVAKVNALAQEIEISCKEQAQAVSQISEGLGQIEIVTQQNTASAEETASSSEELSSQATELNHLVENFTLDKQIKLNSIEFSDTRFD